MTFYNGINLTKGCNWQSVRNPKASTGIQSTEPLIEGRDASHHLKPTRLKWIIGFKITYGPEVTRE